MIYVFEKNKDLVIVRFSYVEIFYVGQVFCFGCYLIYFYFSGSVKGFYVIGCVIYYSFNCVIIMYGIDNFLVSCNVVFNVCGNVFFMEDGIEIGNVVEYNFVIFVIVFLLVLNVDIILVVYWVINVNNIVRYNVVVGGSYFGYWYQMFVNLDGFFFMKDYCFRNVFMYEFFNNFVYLFGCYGLWIFLIYYFLCGG